MIVEPKQYTRVIRFRPREAALQNARARLENMLTNEDNSPNNVDDGVNFRAAKQLEKVVSDIAEDSNTEESRQTTNDLDAVVFLMSETLPNMEDGEIRGSAVKTLKLCEKNEVVASFKNDQYFLKSQSRPNAEFRENGLKQFSAPCNTYFLCYIITHFARRSNVLQVDFLIST